ncbi:hypothetical protein HDU97_009669 [Phlyctochytrium planicorne]|nr:hypothetical protein HDU97_009669 [Phlyctochytrium planicorne]
MWGDIERWRKLGNDTEAATVLGATLEPKRSRRPKPIHHPHKHHPAFPTGRVKEGNIFVHTLFDKLSKNQKQDVHNLWSGHLNPNNLNKKISKICEANNIGSSSKSFSHEHSSFRHHITPHTTLEHQEKDDKELSLAHVDVPDNFNEILEQFDAVCRIKQDQETKAKDNHEDEAHSSETKSTKAKAADSKEILASTKLHFLPSTALHTTKAEKYTSVKAVDSSFVDSKWNYRKSRSFEAGKAAEISEFLKSELQALQSSGNGPGIKRLQVYSACFDKIINEFKTFSPILAEIKAEYDHVINSFDFDQTELEFLRAKVRKLIAQNQNRLLLRYERRKSNDLERRVEKYKEENENLKSELRRKLAIYASYLPPSAIHEKRKNDPMLNEIETQIYAENEDPITIYERKIQQLSEETSSKTIEIDRLTKAQKEDFVPKSYSDKIYDTLKETETSYEKLKIKSAELEQELSEKQSLVAKLENSLREKEEQYHFLISEYTGLSEAIKNKG